MCVCVALLSGSVGRMEACTEELRACAMLLWQHSKASYLERTATHCHSVRVCAVLLLLGAQNELPSRVLRVEAMW